MLYTCLIAFEFVTICAAELILYFNCDKTKPEMYLINKNVTSKNKFSILTVTIIILPLKSDICS